MPNNNEPNNKNKSRWQRFIWWPRSEKQKTVHNKTTKLLQTIANSVSSRLGKWQRKLPDTCPWFLVIGPNLSGKTTAIMQAGYDPVAPNKQHPPYPTNTKTIDAWYGNGHLLLDSTGQIFNPTNTTARKLYSELPPALLSVHRPGGVDGIIIMLSIKELCQEEQGFNETCKTLADICSKCGVSGQTIPLHIMLTHCDTIPGFSKTFSKNSTEEAHDIMCFNYKANDNDAKQATIDEFHNFIRQMQDYTTAELAKTQDQNTTNKLIECRLHLEALAHRVLMLVERLPLESNIELSAIYFINSVEDEDYCINLSSDLLAIPERNILSKTEHKTNPIFLHESFAQINRRSAKTTKHSFLFTYQPIIATVCALLIIAACWIPIQIQQKRYSGLLQSITTIINQPGPHSLATRLQQIDTVEARIADYFGIKTTDTSALATHSIYVKVEETKNKILQTTLTNSLLQTVANRLESQVNSNSQHIYDTLKAYLMLHNQGPKDQNFLNNWFESEWSSSKSWPAAQQNIMSKSLNALLKLGIKSPQKIDQPLVAQARDALQKLPLQVLAYNILVNNIQKTGINLNQSIPTNDNIHLQVSTIPAIYTINNLDNMLNHVIPNIMLLINQRDWVLQRNIGESIKPTNKSQFSAGIRQIYLQNYANQWQSVLNGITINPASTLNATLNRIYAITNAKSNLWGILNILFQNTDTSDKNSDFYKIVGSQFEGLHGIAPTQGINNTIQNNLNNIKSFLQQIQTNRSPLEAAFNVASNRASGLLQNDPISTLNQTANEQPPTIKRWLNVISSSAWHSLLLTSGNYINNFWQKNIAPYWAANLDGRYPLNKLAKQDADMKAFNSFFAPNGKVDNFFNYYIKPFTNTSQSYWTLKQVDGQQLALSQSAMNMFIRAHLIQRMFYTENISTAQITMKLTLLSTSPQNVNVSYKDADASHKFSTDSNANTVSIQLPFINASNSRLGFNSSGKKLGELEGGQSQWSVLRLIDRGTLATSKQANQYTIMFGDDDANASFAIEFMQKDNPLIPGLLNQFQLPQSLLKK